MTFYWYLVVGGGASGCVVAARLVETGKSVLLLGKGKLKFFVGRSLRPLTYRTDKLVLYMFIGLHWLFDPDSRENKLSPCDSFKEDSVIHVVEFVLVLSYLLTVTLWLAHIFI